MPPRERWVLMVEDNIGRRPSTHNNLGMSPRERVRLLLSYNFFAHLSPMQRTILLKRAEHAPEEFRVTTHTAVQGDVVYWFEREGARR